MPHEILFLLAEGVLQKNVRSVVVYSLFLFHEACECRLQQFLCRLVLRPQVIRPRHANSYVQYAGEEQY